VSITATSVCTAGLLTTAGSIPSDSVVFFGLISRSAAIKQNQTEAKKYFKVCFIFVVYKYCFLPQLHLSTLNRELEHQYEQKSDGI
jgi:hypothetical protein